MGLKDRLGRLFGKNETTPVPEAPPPFRGPQRMKGVSPIPPKQRNGGFYDVICPYCMERYAVGELEFRSNSVASPGEGDDGYSVGPDEVLNAFWRRMHQPPPSQEQDFVLSVADTENVIAVQFWEDEDEQWHPNEEGIFESGRPIRGVKDKFGNHSYRHICPKCHNNLPELIGRYPNYIISMMGNTSSGKTVYLNRLQLSLIGGELLPGRELSVRFPAENDDPATLRNRLEEMFYSTGGNSGNESGSDAGGIIEATPIKYMKPIIVELVHLDEHFFVTLFDFPGEAIWKLKEEDQKFFINLMERTNKNADGWLFLLDSTTMPAVRTCVQENQEEEYLSQSDLKDPQLNATPDDMLTQFYNFGNGKQIRTPVALVFSKADMIRRYAEQLRQNGCVISENSPFLHDPAQARRMCADLNDLWQCDRSLRKFLEGDRVKVTAKNFCPRHAYFAVSATGVPVKRNSRIDRKTAAHRVVDPLEWLLWMLGACEGEYIDGDKPLWLGHDAASDGRSELTGNGRRS